MAKEQAGSAVWDHVSVNVSDIERSLRFYCQGLGFESIAEHVVGNEAAATNRVRGDFRMRSRYLRGQDGPMLILNHLEVPPEPLPAPRQQLGLSNFALRVEDLEAAASRVRAAGGEVFDDTRSRFDLGDGLWAEVLVCADPDGQWIELIEQRRISD